LQWTLEERTWVWFDAIWGSDRLCVKTVKDSRRELPDTQPGIGYCGVCSENLEALSIRVPLISRMKFLIGGKNVNTKKKKEKKQREVKPKWLHHGCWFLNRQRHGFWLLISKSVATLFFAADFWIGIDTISCWFLKSQSDNSF